MNKYFRPVENPKQNKNNDDRRRRRRAGRRSGVSLLSHEDRQTNQPRKTVKS